MTALEIIEEVRTLTETIRQPLPKDPVSLLEEADYRSGWLARVGELEAEAQGLLDKSRGEIADKYANHTATMFREKLAGETADLSKVVMYCHRLYTTLMEQIELIRTAISYHKEQQKRT